MAANFEQETLAKWKSEYGEEAHYLSKDNFPFNCFDPIWTLNAAGPKGTTADISCIFDSQLTSDEQKELIFALARLASDSAARSMDNYLRAIKSLLILEVKDLSGHTLKGVYPLLTDFTKKSFKTILNQLAETNEEYYATVNDWWYEQNKNIKKSFNPYCIETGALSEFEQQSLEVLLKKRVEMELSHAEDLFDKWKSREYTQAHPLAHLHKTMAARLNYALVRRGANLQQLKWNDIQPVGAEFINEDGVVDDNINALKFSDENELQVRIWKAKTGAAYRKHVEKYPRRLTASNSLEVLRYYQIYRSYLANRLNILKIEVSEEELDKLMSRSPVFFSRRLFIATFENKAELFSSITPNGEGFHQGGKDMYQAIRSGYMKLGINSDRLPTINVSNNRVRHTVGTRAAIQGHPLVVIADMLGNTTRSAKDYVDLSDEQRANIDIKFIGNNQLIKMFSSTVPDLKKDPRFTICDGYHNEAGQSKSLETCNSCDEIKRPLACYGCDNFRPLVDGDHENILADANRLYESRKKQGTPEHTLSKLRYQIRWVEIAIILCNEHKIKKVESNVE